MGKIAHLKVTCPQCGKYTSIYVEEGGTSAKVKCEHCKQIFEFGKGMMYEPIAYVPSIPQWAVISAADNVEVFSQAIQCKKCGKSYNKSDMAVEAAIPKDGIRSMSNPAYRKLLGMKSLLKCGNCGAIACSDCALKSDGIIKMACPFCKTDYTIYSFIKPAAENIQGKVGVKKQQAPTLPDSNAEKRDDVSQGKIVSSSTEYKGIQWYLKVMKQYADFSGRARRTEYWMFALFNVIFCIAAIILDNVLGLAIEGVGYGIIYFFYLLAVLIPGLAVSARRLHDTGKSAWMLLIAFIPFAGGIWLLVLTVTEGQRGKNKYGTDPKTSQQTFSEQARMKSAGITLTVAAALMLLTSIIGTLLLYFQHGLTYFFPLYLSILCEALLLAAGIFIMKEKEIYRMKQQGKIGMILLLIVASISVLSSITNLVRILAWNGMIISILSNILFNLSMIFLAASLLYSPKNKDLIRKAAISVIVFSGLQLIGYIYFTGISMNHNIEPWMQLSGILLPVAYIVLAGTFLSKKDSDVIASRAGSRLTSWANSASDSVKRDVPPQPAITPKKEEKKSILDRYRAGLSYLDRCGTFDETKLREFNRITGNQFSNADIESYVRSANLMIRGMEDVKQTLRSTMLEGISTFEELERNGIDLSKYDI